MIIKCLEIRDSGTCIPAIAIKMSAAGMVEDTFLWREGYPRDGKGVVLMRLSNQEAHSDVYDWSDSSRTMRTAALYIEKNFDDLQNGQVVCVENILGERETPKEPEIHKVL